MTSSVNENYIIEMIRLKIILGVFKNFYLSLDGDDYNNEQHYLQVSNMAKMAHDLHHEITQILENKIGIMTYINNKLDSMKHILFHYDIIID